MKLLIKAAVGAALLGAASVPAYATVVVPPASGPTPVPGLTAGGIVVEVFDLNNGDSLAEWLGPTTTTFGTPAATPAGGETLDYGILGGAATFNSLFSASEIAAGNVEFIVEGANAVTPSTPTLDVTSSGFTGTGKVTGSAVSGYVSGINSAISSVLNGTTACNNVNPCTATPTTTGNSAVTGLGVTAIGQRTTNGIAGGSAVDFYQIISTGSALGAQTLTAFGNATGLATWTLSATGDLVYSVPGATAPPPVPLPPAVWLLGSGLLGLFGVARRKSLTA